MEPEGSLPHSHVHKYVINIIIIFMSSIKNIEWRLRDSNDDDFDDDDKPSTYLSSTYLPIYLV